MAKSEEQRTLKFRSADFDYLRYFLPDLRSSIFFKEYGTAMDVNPYRVYRGKSLHSPTRERSARRDSA